MIKCPFCHFDNEDGALFCERCTSDLSGVAATPSKAPPPPAVPVVPAMPAVPIAEAMPFAMAEPIEALPMAVAEPVEALPLEQAEPIDLAPMARVDSLPMKPAAFAEPLMAVEPMPVAPPAPPPAPPPPAPEPVAVAPPTPPPAVALSPTAPPAAAPSSDGVVAPLPAGAQPRLQVLRGQKRNVEYPVYPGLNFIGRADDKPVDIDLEEQEPPDRIWCSRQHACIAFEGDQLVLEDLNSANGTYVNRGRVYPGQKKQLAVGDIVQIGNVQLKVLA